jgi:tetratricopeptide (TPR) repeat protein
MKEAMEKLQEALRNMDPEELRKALEDFQMSSEELLDKLDRSIALMKLLAIEQKMDLLNQLAEKILQDQMELNENVESAGDSSSLAELSGMCQNNSDQFDVLKEQFEQLKEMDSEMNLVPDSEKTQADQEINNPEIPDDFSAMFGSMCQGNGGMCQSKGKNLEENLRRVAQALQNAQNAMLQSMMREIVEKLQKAAEDLLYLSQRQEKLIVSTRLNDNTAELLRDFAGEQSDIRAATARIAEMISEISRQTVFVNFNLLRVIGQALANLGDASHYLNERRASDAVNSETMAMSNINLAVLMLFKANEAAQNSCSGSGMAEMMQKLGQMSKKQGILNQQTQSLMPLPGMQMSRGQRNSLRDLAAQQDALRRQLEELGQDFGQRGELLGRLDDLAKEMKKVTDDMSHARVDRRTLERQERILSRLLDAQKSVNRREFSRKRKADEGLDVIRKGPDQSGDDSSYESWLSGAVRKALEESYPRKYDRLIKAYFKSLQNQGAEIEP